MPKTNNQETVFEYMDNSKQFIIIHPTDKDVLCGKAENTSSTQVTDDFGKLSALIFSCILLLHHGVRSRRS
jgi:hypothetical protein